MKHILFLLKADQAALFDMPVMQAGYVNKKGTFVPPAATHRKKRADKPKAPEQNDLFGEAPAPKGTRDILGEFIAKKGGERRIASMLDGLTGEQRAHLVAEMARVGKTTADAVEARLAMTPPAPAVDDLFSPANAPKPVKAKRSASDFKYFSDFAKDRIGGIPSVGTAAHAELKAEWDAKAAESPKVETTITPTPPASTTEAYDPARMPTFGVPAGIGKAARRALNAEAARLVAEKAPVDMSEADLAVLRQYSGNGGCGDSLNEFYTDPAVAGAMWAVAARLGFPEGTALEPSCATGVFLHTAPQGVKVIGVELDPVSSKIAVALHPGHEIVNASLERFATQDMRRVGIAIGNPPYGPRGSLLKDDKKDLGKAEEYFIDTSLDKTLPDGLCVMVVPAGIMDSKNGRAFRERMLRKAEFLGAQRMPNSAFEASHTDVTADIIYLRKRPDEVAGALGTVGQDVLRKLGVWDDEFLGGGYFEKRGAGNLFGSAGTAKRAFGEIYTVNGSMNGVPEEIAKFVPHPVGSTPDMPAILEALGDDAARNRAMTGAKSIPYQDTAKVGDIRTIDGVDYVLQGNPPRWRRVDEAMQTEAVTEAQALAGELDRLMTGQAADRPKLEADIRAWVARHGVPANNPNLLVAAATDKTLYRLIGAVGKDGALSDVVTGRMADRIEGTFDTVAHSLALKHESGEFTLDELAEAMGKDRDETLDHLTADASYAWGGLDRWAPMNFYLTGELWPKLDAAQALLANAALPPGMREKVEAQVKRLEDVIDAKSLEDVEIKVNSAFIPLRILDAWRDAQVAQAQADYPTSTYYQGLEPSSVTFDKGVYYVSGGVSDPLLTKYLNRSGVKKDDLPLVEKMNDEFKTWLAASKYREEVEDLYNRKFKGFVPKEFSGEPIDVPGLANHDKIKDYQWPGLRWALASGKGIIAADVGLGKAQPLDAKILTPAGWKLMGDIQVGDLVIAGDGTPTEVTGVFPQGAKEIFRVTFSDGAATECCAEHLWLTQTQIEKNNARRGCGDGGIPKVRALAEIMQTLRYRGSRNHAIPMIKNVEFAGPEVPLHPYLLGALIGDGSLVGFSPAITKPEQAILDAIAGMLPSGMIGKQFAPEGNRPSLRLRRDVIDCTTRNAVGAVLDVLGMKVHSPEKFIPDAYKFNSSEVRLAVLHGLMDTDGYVSKNGCAVQYTSTSQRLADDVVFLVQSLGGNAWISTKTPTFTHKGEKRTGRLAYTVGVRMPSGVVPFLHSRKVERFRESTKYLPIRYFDTIEPVGVKPAQCISVAHPSRLYVTDNFIVTHNTLRGLLLARMSKINGSAKKPGIVVPKSVLANWYAECQKWFPSAKVLTIGAEFTMKDGKLTGRDDNANERKRKYHDLSQNDYDFVIISEPAFQELDLDPITKENYYSKDFWVQRGDSLEQAGDKRRKRIKEAYEQAIAQREIGKRTDAIYFNDIGIDMLIADEMHHQKNLYAAKTRFGEAPKFLGGQGLSDRSMDFNLKARWLLENHGGKGIYGLTATPTKNSPLEIFSMLSHIAPEAFENIGIRNSEDFLDRFCEFTKDNILNTRGEIEEALVTSGFKNMGELREIMKRYIDRTTAEQVGLMLPARDDHLHFVTMSPAQEAVYADLRIQLEESARDKDATGDSHIFSIMDKMNKAALDLEILDPVAHAGEKSPKYAALAKHVAEGLADGGQVVFSDYIDSHDKIVAALVAAGIPRDKIGVINAQVASSSVKRQNIADAYNSGKLLVVIGNTATMGEGLNLQKGTTDIHHADLPWEPASMQQRNGRGLRQGNISEAVRIHTYLSKGSFDGYRHQAIAAKKDWQDLIWGGGDRVENLSREGKFSREDIQIMMAADPDAARAKFAADKALATAQHEAGERVKAASEFVRFQELKAGFKALKNKGTATAARLKQKLDAAHTALKSNRFFTAKAALDSDVPTVIQPQTGEAYHAGVAFQAVNDAGVDEGKFVVTGVNVRAGTVTVRDYAGTEKHSVDLETLRHGITHFKYDPEAEAKEVAAKMEKAAAEKVNSLKKYEDVYAMPSNVLTANKDAIQRQLFEGALGYKVAFPYQTPMVNKATGKVEMMKSYEIKGKEGTHDFLLPTDENKKKVEDAWMDARRTRTFGIDYVTRKPGKTETRAMSKYRDTGYDQRGVNPYSQLVNDQNQEKQSYGATTPTIRALKKRFEKQQLERVRRAKTFTEAIREAAPLGNVINPEKGHGAGVRWNRRALAILWAKARHDGVLGREMKSLVPKAPESRYDSGLHDAYAYHHTQDMSVHNALYRMAVESGQRDLAVAMAKAAEKHHPEGNAREALAAMSRGWGHTAAELRAMLKVAEKSGDADMTMAALGLTHNGLLQDYRYSGNSNRTVRDVIEESLNIAEKREAEGASKSKEAA
jgi:SNF2 family DNA or RNA helicase